MFRKIWLHLFFFTCWRNTNSTKPPIQGSYTTVKQTMIAKFMEIISHFYEFVHSCWENKSKFRTAINCINSMMDTSIIIDIPAFMRMSWYDPHAMNDVAAQSRQEVAVSALTSKDDIVCLLHLFKEPRAQHYWTNLYSILSRPELDARKSSREYLESANPLDFLAEIFNDYNSFRPQNLMVQYVSQSPNSRPVKKFQYVPISSEWTYLSTFTHELDPTNLSRRNILRGANWIKATWGKVRKYLHRVFYFYVT